jgi:hypothetical protein
MSVWKPRCSQTIWVCCAATSGGHRSATSSPASRSAHQHHRRERSADGDIAPSRSRCRSGTETHREAGLFLGPPRQLKASFKHGMVYQKACSAGQPGASAASFNQHREPVTQLIRDAGTRFNHLTSSRGNGDEEAMADGLGSVAGGSQSSTGSTGTPPSWGGDSSLSAKSGTGGWEVLEPPVFLLLPVLLPVLCLGQPGSIPFPCKVELLFQCLPTAPPALYVSLAYLLTIIILICYTGARQSLRLPQRMVSPLPPGGDALQQAQDLSPPGQRTPAHNGGAWSVPHGA